MSPKQDEIQFTVNLETDVLDRLRSMAKHGDISRHKLMVNILKAGIDDIKTLENVGIFRIALLVRNLIESPEQANIRRAGEIKIAEMPVPLRIQKNYVDRLDRLAGRGEITRQRLAQNIIKTGLEELETMKKLKITDVVIKIRDMKDLFADVLEIGKRAFFAGKEVNTK